MKPLIRRNENKIKKLFVIGNGCIENGTNPLETLITECENLNTNVFRINATKIDPMHALSCLAAEERMFLNILLASLLTNSSNGHYYTPPTIDNKPGFLKALGAMGSCASFRLEMGRRYLEDKNIKVKDKAKEILANLGLFEADAAAVTLNWDNCLWNIPDIKNLTHLHGRCSDPMTMIFPTETINEYYLHSILVEKIIEVLNSLSNEHKKQNHLDLFLDRYFIKDKGYKNLFESENYLNRWLNEANEIYFCGIAFNTYDHELTNSFGMYSSSKTWKRIAILSRVNNKDLKLKSLSGILKQNPSTIEFINTSD